jgi:hypothetical protein
VEALHKVNSDLQQKPLDESVYLHLYLELLRKMFPAKRLLLVVDRSTTHYGKIIAGWLADNHASKSNSKIFIEYFQEGMTSIHRVCDISINKPWKALIKKEYFKFR